MPPLSSDCPKKSILPLTGFCKGVGRGGSFEVGQAPSAQSRDEEGGPRSVQGMALLRRCMLPASKSFDGYDWSVMSWSERLGKSDLPSISFLDGTCDLVLMSNVGRGKTHAASAQCFLACRRRLEARFLMALWFAIRPKRSRRGGSITNRPR